MNKCLSLNRKNKNCIFNCINETQFCKFHQYMVSYTPEMLSKLELCKGCKKMYYFGDDTKTCEKCRDRGKSNKEMVKESVVLCSKSGCKFKRSAENEYCGKHQLCLFEDETKILGKKRVVILFADVEANWISTINFRDAKNVLKRKEKRIKIDGKRRSWKMMGL